MPYETLILAREESFAVITLNRPPANAISVDLMRELNAALSDVESDPAVRSVIITGAGDRIFCAGADLGSAFSGPDVVSFIRFGNSVVRRIERFPKPVVAAINGHALGGGCEIAMGCHIRILKESARMGQTESNLGIIPGYGGTQRLPRLVGRGLALEHLILGTQIPAAECYRSRSAPSSARSRPRTRARASRPSSRSVPPSSRATRAMIRAHLLRWRPRPHAQRTGSTPRVRLSGAALPLDPSHRSSQSVSPTGN